MSIRSRWTREQLLVAFAMYCRLPFGRLHYRNPEVVRLAECIGRTPSALAMKLTNIASLDPAVTSTGRTGLKGASAKDRAMWEEMNKDWERFAVESQRAIDAAETRATPDAVATKLESQYPVGEDRDVQTTARIGQRFFRAAVMSAYDGRCCITGLSISSLLVAGHIVPWSQDKLNRTNPRNGLLLSVLHEKAFDEGIFTLDDDLAVRVSRKYSGSEDRYFRESIRRYEGRAIRLPRKFGPDRELLAYHRAHIFDG